METAKNVVRLSMVAAAVLASGTVLFSAPASAENNKYTYTSSGKGISASEANYSSCGYSDSYFDALENVSRDSSGKNTGSLGYFGSYSYDYCNGNYKSCWGWIDLNSIKVSGNKGTAQGTGAISCYSGSWWGGYSSYTENITADVAVTCSGEYSYNDKYSQRTTYAGPWGVDIYSYSGKGSYCSAQATGSITGDIDTNITLGQAEYNSASISDWKSKTTTVSKYKP
ncbi:hypothetical protein [Candidatus Electronema sp. PJ]|uniref:hypothetical protein n=1 Tax=Candidatus Electronema sp. PJ TaxID=3401572 RepID=UPI003AA87F07